MSKPFGKLNPAGNKGVKGSLDECSAVTVGLFPCTASYRHLSTRFDARQGVLWCIMDPKGARASAWNFSRISVRWNWTWSGAPTRPPRRPSVALFRLRIADTGCVQLRRRPRLAHPVRELQGHLRISVVTHDCASTCCTPTSSISTFPITTISLVQGNALGGGFEAALGGDVVIAEKSALCRVPRSPVQPVPGNGSVQFLSRRIGMARTERMILGGKTFRPKSFSRTACWTSWQKTETGRTQSTNTSRNIPGRNKFTNRCSGKTHRPSGSP